MRLIDADELKKLRDDYIQGKIKFDGNENDLIDRCPTVDAEPVRHGEWKYRQVRKLNSKGELINYCSIPYCSECGREYGTIRDIPYCNCGAKMNGVFV